MARLSILERLIELDVRQKSQINKKGAYKKVYNFEKHPNMIVKTWNEPTEGAVKIEYNTAKNYPDLFATIHKVNFDKNYLIQQKLNTQSVEDELEMFGEYLDLEESDVLIYFEELTKDVEEAEEFRAELENVNPNLLKKFDVWLEFLEKVSNIKVPKGFSKDINPGNMGYDEKGKLKLLDI